MAPAPVVTIVLVTYDGAEHLPRLCASLRALRCPTDWCSLIVVDNGPERAAAEWFAAHTADVRVIVPGWNTGYAGGNALAMEEAIAAGADYVAVVTQDTDVDPLWLRELVDVAERFPEAGAIQPKILRRRSDGPPVIHTWGNELHFTGVGYVGGDGQPDRPLDVRSIPYASGAGVLYRASALREVGGLDPEYFMYHEDTDLSWRMRLAGWDILLAPRAVMFHDYRFGRGGDKFYFIERNRLINVLTHYRLRTLALLAPALVLFEAVTLAFALREGWFWRRLAVYRFFLRPATWRYLRRKRGEVQAIRRAPDRAIAPRLTGRIASGPLQGRLLRWVVNPMFATYWRLVRSLIVW